MEYEIWTDGACIPNPGNGGWAWIRDDGVEAYGVEAYGFEIHTTSNRMEILAVIEAITHLPERARALIYSDSQYVVYTMNKNWNKKKNIDLWQRLDKAIINKEIKFKWIRGHNGDLGNELADELANKAIKEIS